MMRQTVVLVLTLAIAMAVSPPPFSPLSTFFDIDVSTSATFFSGKSFGPGCAAGGTIPHGFIAVAMNGVSVGMKSAAAVCGMCVAIKGPAPQSPNPAENQGVVGEYYAYVYEVCEECTQSAGLQLGIPGKGQSNVVWRAIPCPSKQQMSLFFDGSTASKARFQIRGLSAPIIAATVNGRELPTEGSFFKYENGTSTIYPFTVSASTALGEQISVTVPAYREYGELADLISVRRDVPARPTAAAAPVAIGEFGSGSLSTSSGGQIRTVSTTDQAGRQIVTITTSPVDNGGAAAGPAQLPQIPQQNVAHDNTRPPLYANGYGQPALSTMNDQAERSRLEQFLTSPEFMQLPDATGKVGYGLGADFGGMNGQRIQI
jgi:hypothetical protein